jgi:hypothetical protein
MSLIVCPSERQLAGIGPFLVEIAITANKPGPGEIAYTKVANVNDSKVNKSIGRL